MIAIMLYWVDKSEKDVSVSTAEKKVCVLRVLYGKRNWTEMLKNNTDGN